MLAAAAAAAACVREPAEAVCPPLAAGDLVVTELRGPQQPAGSSDPLGAWVELYNGSGRAIDLLGVRLRFRGAQDEPDDGLPVLVRRSTPAAAGSYTVLGLFDGAEPPPHVDYGFDDDFAPGAADPAATWLRTVALHVESCGAELDFAPYQPPAQPGTWSLGGVPDAGRNDAPSSWCRDGTQVGAAFPGTPRSQNVTCP